MIPSGNVFPARSPLPDFLLHYVSVFRHNTKVRIICQTTKFILHFVIPLPCCIFVSMYDDLLLMRDILSDIASELYGEL